MTVCHYPPGASKWNPIEHRLFSEISKRWAGEPLVSVKTVLHYIRTTHTDAGLRVSARFVRQKYRTGERIPQKKMDDLCVCTPRYPASMELYPVPLADLGNVKLFLSQP